MNHASVPGKIACITMDELLAGSEVKHLKTGDMVEGVVTSVQKHEVWVDLGANGIGVIFRREVGTKALEEGESITASVVDPELDEGYALLSMKRAVKDRGWGELQRVFDEQEIIEVMPYDANRGGLLIELEGIRGFLPVSQLAAEHYPRVSDTDKDEILTKLNSLVKQKPAGAHPGCQPQRQQTDLFRKRSRPRRHAVAPVRT